MYAGIARSRLRAAMLLLVSLICAACNLDAPPDEATSRFDGPPVIHIAAPQPGQIFQAGATVIVQARIEKAGPDLARVAVLLDEAVLGEKLLPNESAAAVLPLTIDWPTSQAGQFTLSVLAERADGSASREDVSVEVTTSDQFAENRTASAPEPMPAATSLSQRADAALPPAREGVNLLVTAVELDPATPICGQAITVRASVRNNGSLDAQTSPWVSAKARLLSDDSVAAENAETTYLPKLAAGEETLLEMSLAISAHHSQTQRIFVMVDAGNHILEADEDDNIGSSAEFTLSPGDCA